MGQMQDFSFQGPIYLGENVNGKPHNLKWVGDQTSLNLSVDAQFEERKENYSDDRTTSVKLKQSTAVNPELVLRYITPENILLGVHGKLNKIAAGSVTGEVFPIVEVEQLVLLDKGNISNLVLTDSATTPTTLVEGQHYAIELQASGMIKILDITGLTQPIKAAYSHGGMTNVSMLTALPPIRYLYMEAINTVDGRRARVHLYRVQFDPLSNLALTNESLSDFTLSASCLSDAVNRLDDTLGAYGRIEWLDDEE